MRVGNVREGWMHSTQPMKDGAKFFRTWRSRDANVWATIISSLRFFLSFLFFLLITRNSSCMMWTSLLSFDGSRLTSSTWAELGLKRTGGEGGDLSLNLFLSGPFDREEVLLLPTRCSECWLLKSKTSSNTISRLNWSWRNSNPKASLWRTNPHLFNRLVKAENFDWKKYRGRMLLANGCLEGIANPSPSGSQTMKPEWLSLVIMACKRRKKISCAGLPCRRSISSLMDDMLPTVRGEWFISQRRRKRVTRENEDCYC